MIPTRPWRSTAMAAAGGGAPNAAAAAAGAEVCALPPQQLWERVEQVYASAQAVRRSGRGQDGILQRPGPQGPLAAVRRSDRQPALCALRARLSSPCSSTHLYLTAILDSYATTIHRAAPRLN